MNTLENNAAPLKEIVKGLTNEEINSVRRYLNCFDETFGNNKTKTANLFDLLISDEELSQEDMMNILYTSPASEDAFEKLSKRLMEKIHECLLLDINVERKDVYADFVKASIDVRKKIMQVHIILGRGLSKDIDSLYDKIIAKAKKYELYSELVETLHLKQMFLGLRQGKSEFDKITEDYKFYSDCRDSVYKAQNYYYQFMVNNEFSSLNQIDIDYFETCLDELRSLYNKTQSANIGYYLYLLEIESFQLNGQYDKAKLTCLKLVDLVQENSSIYMKRRLGTAFINLSINELYTYDFKSAALHARLAQDYYHKNTMNHSIAKETEFYSHFYQGNLEKAETIINSLVKDSNNLHSAFHHSKRSFLAANVSFLLKKKKETNNFISETKEIDKDKEGWNIGIRILSIMSQIDGGVVDIAESQIENMRKHIERTMKMKDVRGRDILILRILNELVNESFDFKAVWKSRKQLFDQLASDDSEYRWEIKGHEMVLFHEWFKSKVFNTEYLVNIASPAEVSSIKEERVFVKVANK